MSKKEYPTYKEFKLDWCSMKLVEFGLPGAKF